MSSRSCSIKSFAKLNLDLRVLHKRSDGFHELRTIFQTINLHDTIRIELDFAKRIQIDVSIPIEIQDNIVVRAAKLILDELKLRAWVRFFIDKRIPLGAGLGGGSSNAASVLLALPALAGKRLPPESLFRFAKILGSDVPFFLHGGTALGLGRGTELYPLPDLPAHHALVVSTGIHVSTPEAYRSLERSLTSSDDSPILREFQTIAWTLNGSRLEQLPLRNDFEEVVFRIHPQLAAVSRKLRRLGAKLVRMTGSGSAVFGVFSTGVAVRQAARNFPAAGAFPVRFLTRSQYQRAWK